jgi:hypothetical protein
VIAVARLASVGSNPIVVVVVAVLVVIAGRKVARRVASNDRDPGLVKILTWGLVLHLLCAPAQIFVVDHIYNGLSDYNRYLFQGTYLADNIRAGHFTLSGTGITTILGDGMVSIISSVVLSILGPNKLAEFLVFAFLSYVGDVCFYRAFSITFPGANTRRYAYFLFFMPSLLFWTADISKEAVMTFALGVATLGVAKVLARAKGGYILILVGTLIAVGVRPHELALLLVAFAIAMLFRGRDPNQKARLSRRIFTVVFIILVLGGTAYLAQKLLGSTSLSAITSKVNANNSNGTGVGFGSSNVSYSSNPLYYPKDLYTVLFDPLPITAHSGSQLLAAGENSLIVLLILASLRQLKSVFRVMLRKPYILVCVIYSIAFVYVFAALGNLGLIERERVLLLPFLLALLAIPISPKGTPPRYPWERRKVRRKDRARHAAPPRRAAATR